MNQKMIDQGFNETYGTHGYAEREDLILQSDKQVAYFQEIDGHKLENELRRTTTSGKARV